MEDEVKEVGDEDVLEEAKELRRSNGEEELELCWGDCLRSRESISCLSG